MVDVMLSWCLEFKEAVMTLQSFARRTCMSCPGLKREHARIRPLRRRNGKGGMSIHAHAIYAAGAEMWRREQ